MKLSPLEQQLQRHVQELEADRRRLVEERDRVVRELRLLDEHGNLRAAIRAAAERQREACAKEAEGVSCHGHGMDADEAGTKEACVDAVRATPLVTEVES